jgi:hypothetical protein
LSLGARPVGCDAGTAQERPSMDRDDMDEYEDDALPEDLDRRLARIEQLLATLATKEELEAVSAAMTARLATRDQLQAATATLLAGLPTKEDLEAASARLLAALAGRIEQRAGTARLAARDDIHAEGERTRRHVDAVAGGLEGRLEAHRDGLGGLRESVETVRGQVLQELRELQSEVRGVGGGLRSDLLTSARQNAESLRESVKERIESIRHTVRTEVVENEIRKIAAEGRRERAEAARKWLDGGVRQPWSAAAEDSGSLSGTPVAASSARGEHGLDMNRADPAGNAGERAREG